MSDLPGAATLIMGAIERWREENLPLGRRSPLPEGLAVELSYKAMLMMAQDWDFWRHRPEADSFGGMNVTDALATALGVPVRVSEELEPGYWCLVITARDVKIGGRLPEGQGT